MSRQRARHTTPSPVALSADDAGYRALLADCRDTISLALRAVEIGASPGPAWRKRAKELIAIIDQVTA